jgi:hypothetical protein
VRVAVVGHFEWVQFVQGDHVPAAGEIVHASDAFEEPAGGGAVADRTLTIATTLRATGETPVPVSFGYHPYFSCRASIGPPGQSRSPSAGGSCWMRRNCPPARWRRLRSLAVH